MNQTKVAKILGVMIIILLWSFVGAMIIDGLEFARVIVGGLIIVMAIVGGISTIIYYYVEGDKEDCGYE